MRNLHVFVFAHLIFALSAIELWPATPTTITPNGLGTSVLPPTGGIYNIQGGTTAGSNLYHSFSTFNLGTGNTANFNVSNNIANILARVTGGPSSIDGTITSTIGAGGALSSANLFLLNPAGVMFTANAQVNLGGSFVVSTANYIKFSDGTYFYGDLNHPANDAGLTTAPVSAFGFLTPTPSPISFSGTQIALYNGISTVQGIDIIGGDITLDQDSATLQPTLLVPSKTLTIFSAASTGEVPFSLTSPGSGYATAPFSAFGNITLQNRTDVHISTGSSKIVIRGGKFVVDDSRILSANSGTNTGGSISVQADQLMIQDIGEIISYANSTGNAGNVSVTANSLTVDGTTAAASTGTALDFYGTGIFSLSNHGATGSSGSVGVTVANELSILNGGLISGDTNSAGNGGAVTVSAGSLTLDGAGSAISADAIAQNSTVGNAGSINVTTTGALTLTNGAQIESSLVDSGGAQKAGKIIIQAGSLTLDGTNSLAGSTGIFVNSTDATGTAGLLTLNISGPASLVGGGEINFNTGVAGNAGAVSLNANTLSLTNSSSIATGSTGTASGATLTLTVTQALNISDGAEVITSTSGSGNGGTVSVTSGSASLDGASLQYGTTGIISESIGTGTAGSAGALTVTTTSGLNVNDGGEIASATLSSGNNGATSIEGGPVMINGVTAAASSLHNGIFANPLSTQYPILTLDGSLGTKPSELFFGPIYQIPATMGEQVGNNLFFSFGLFNLSQGDVAAISGTSGIQDIVARVTGGGSSNIDGEIASTISGASIFLLNPAGMIFGPQGDVKVTGSFAASTANYAKFDDPGTGIFFAATGNNDVLSGAPVDALGFLTATPQPISFDGTQLAMQAGQGLAVIGGAITLNDATLQASGGDLTIFSAASSGEVPVDMVSPESGIATAPFSAVGNITLQNDSAVAIDGLGGGDLVIRGGEMMVDNSRITSADSGSATGGDIYVQADSLTLKNSSSATNTTSDANDAEINTSTTDTAGNAGSVTVNVSGQLSVIQGTSISSLTTGEGNAGEVNVAAGTLSVDGAEYLPGSSAASRSEISSISTNSVAVIKVAQYGAAGEVNVQAGDLSVTGGARITTSTNTNGIAGPLNIWANTITVSGVSNNDPTDLPNNVITQSTIGSNTFGTKAAGDLTINAGSVTITDAGQINASSASAGNAGALTINADTLEIEGEEVQLTPRGTDRIMSFPSEVFSTTGGSGNAGVITLNISGGINLSDGGEISTESVGSKPGGTVNVTAGSLSIDGIYFNPAIAPSASGIYSTANTTNGGVVNVTLSGNLSLTNGGEISASSTKASAGNISIQASTLLLQSGAQIDTSAKVAGGNIMLEDPLSLVIDGSQITANAQTGQGGAILASTSNFDSEDALISSSAAEGGGITLAISGQANISDSKITTSSTQTGGDITIGDPQSLVLNNSQITADAETGIGGAIEVSSGNIQSNGSEISSSAAEGGDITVAASGQVNAVDTRITTSSTQTGGNITFDVGNLVYFLNGAITSSSTDTGGNIFIDPEFVVLNDTSISANAALGQGGNITIITDYFMENNSLITATGATTDGTINISAPILNLSGSLIALPAELVNDEWRLRESCARSINHEFSSFIVVGRGGTESAPEELSPDFGMDALPHLTSLTARHSP